MPSSTQPPSERHASLVAALCRHIEAAEQPPSLDALAAQAHMSPHHLHRVFKAITGVTPKAYADAHRARKVREALGSGQRVTEALHKAGFQAPSRFYEGARQRLGMAPRTFQTGGQDTLIHFAVAQSSLGAVLVAAPLLETTPLAPLVPVADTLLVLVLALVVVREPLHRFRLALRETAGAACEPELIARTRCAATALVEAAAAQLLDLSVVKLGRINYVVAYVNPAGAVEASWLDGLRDQLDGTCGGLLGPVRTEVVLTGRPPFAIHPSAAAN